MSELDIEVVNDNGDPNMANDILEDEDEEQEYEQETSKDELDFADHSIILSGTSGTDKKYTSPYMTKYEIARVVGFRIEQICRGAPALIDTKGMTDVVKIAEKELKEKMTPIIIRRKLPNGKYEDWRIQDFIVTN
jgi:DNA-directed RNA polymerase subunit K/omega